MLRPISLTAPTSNGASGRFNVRSHHDGQANRASEALRWLSLSEDGEGTDVDRDICRLALICDVEPDELAPPAWRRLM